MDKNKVRSLVALFLYYSFAYYLPNSYIPILGRISNAIRIWCVKHIFKKCGEITTVNRKAYFGKGTEIEIGDFSGIGENCIIPPNTIIGKYVMMAEDVYIVDRNHTTSCTDTPMCFQGYEPKKTTIIEDDVWIGARVMIMPGRRIGKGAVCASASIITKDIEPYSIVGGNPAKLIKKRK